MEAQELLCTVIEAVLAVKENFKADYIIDIIQGKETSEVQAHLHEDLEVFGSGMGEEDKNVECCDPSGTYCRLPE